MNGEKFAITSVLGHIFQTDFPPTFNNWRRVNPRVLINVPIQKKVIRRAVEQTIQDVVRGADTLIIMCDNDREGENIGVQIVQIALRISPTLQVKRMRFSAVTPEQIWTAYRNLDELNLALSNASEARQEIDLRLGSSFTRKATLSVQERTPTGVISIGPVQTPTLGLVVKRWEVIQKFKPKPFWYLIALVHVGSELLEARWERGRVYHREEVEKIFERIKTAKTAVITKVVSKIVPKSPPPPLNTVALTSIAAKALSMASGRTMEIAEALYNTGWISYPRTETQIYHQTLNLKKIVEDHAKTKTEWSKYAKTLLEHGFVATKGKRDDKAHPPIHPVKAAVSKTALTRISELKKYPKAWQVYELVTRHFFATLSRPARIYIAKVVLNIATVPFLLRGHMLLVPGYLQVYPYEHVREKYLPKLKEGMNLAIKEITLREEKTSPPAPYNEKELIKRMDKLGLGTDATIPQHITTNLKRGYFMISSNRNIHPTPRGIALIESLENSVPILVEPEIRAYMERQIMTIQKGEKTYEMVLTELRSRILTMYDVFSTNIDTFTARMIHKQQEINNSRLKNQQTRIQLRSPRLIRTNQKIGTCSLCGADTFYFEQQTKRWIRCSNYPQCQKIFPLPATPKGQIFLLSQRCFICQDPLLLYKRNDRKHFKICAKCGVWCWKCLNSRICQEESK